MMNFVFKMMHLGFKMMNFVQQAAVGGRPSQSFARLVGMYCVGRWYGYVLSCLPSEAAGAAMMPLKTLVQDIPDHPNLPFLFDINISAGLLVSFYAETKPFFY